VLDLALTAGKWAEPSTLEMLLELGPRIEERGLVGFTTYSIVTAYGETRGDASEISSIGAAGIFQILPTSAGLSTVQLQDRRTSIAAAANLAQRLAAKYAGWFQTPDWYAVRRGWKYPRLVSDRFWLQSWPTRERLFKAIDALADGVGETVDIRQDFYIKVMARPTLSFDEWKAVIS
jgi:hypothetical protein